jgi:Tfp pilus assembly protein PilN
MITINLLPADRKKSTANLVLRFIVVVVALLIMGVTAGAAVGVYTLTAWTTLEIRQTEKELDELSDVVQMSENLENSLQLLRDKKKIIDQLVTHRVEWSPKLLALAQLLPNRVWLEDMEVETVVTREKIEETAGSASRRRSTRPQYREIRTDYLHVTAVTDSLKEKSALIGDLLARIKANEQFYSDFKSVDFQQGEEEHWVVSDKESPIIWRFKVTLELKQPGDLAGQSEKSSGQEEDEKGGSGSDEAA